MNYAELSDEDDMIMPRQPRQPRSRARARVAVQDDDDDEDEYKGGCNEILEDDDGMWQSRITVKLDCVGLVGLSHAPLKSWLTGNQ